MPKIERAGVKVRKGNTTNLPVNVGDIFETLGTSKPGEVKFVNGLLFGPPKTGKTTLACSGSKVLLIELDPEGAATETLAGREDITVLTPTSLADVNAIIAALHGARKGEFDWVVLDSLTFLFQMAIGKELNDTYTEGKNIMRPYGKGGAAVSQIVNDLVAVPANVMFTAHLAKESEGDEAVSVDQSLGEHEVKVAVTPMVWKTLGPAVGFIGRTFRAKEYETIGKVRKAVTKFKVSFNDGEKSPAGSRYSMDGEYEHTPTLLNDVYTHLRKENT